MINVSEVTGIFIIPLGIHFSNVIWNLMNELGLLFLPFAIAICMSWNKARAMGKDEGAAEIMALKLIEAKFITMVGIYCLFVMPVDVGSGVRNSITNEPHSRVNFRAYSCNPERSSILQKGTRVEPNYTNFQGYNMSLPPMIGVINQGVQGVTQSIIGKMPCDQNASIRLNSGMTAVLSAKDDNKLAYSVKEFYEQCYSPALANINTSINAGLYNNGVPLSSKQRRYISSELSLGYGGLTINPQTNINFPPLTAVVESDTWVSAPSGQVLASNGKKRNVSCSVLVFDLSKASIDHIDKYYDGEAKSIAESKKLYRDNDGSLYPTTQSAQIEVEDKLVHQLMLDVTGNAESIFNRVQGTSPAEEFKNTSDIADGLAYVTGIITSIEKNVANQAYGLLAPIMISLLLSLVIAVSPMLIVISGYNPMVASMVGYLFCFLIGTQYVFEVGLYLETVLMKQAISEFSIMGGDNFNMGYLVLKSVIPVLIGVWSFLGALLGVLVIPIFSQLIQSLTTNIATYGVMLSQKIIGTAIQAAMGGSPVGKLSGAISKMNKS
ncbi:conjugal transfer protein TraG N-terminal domain-containing protein [Vibrio crassostreae]|uniref:conjugal transfer protein TraG N-terminal domain-containing protein n=1 Tax=Vibrio crassostreae TaxID=246167 RepID=UPI001B307A10|nr:conjugal transfer protein TraG N-terminal domain-containing protein [Vibrio crassostreae]